MLTAKQIKTLKKGLKKPYFKSVTERSEMSERSVSSFFEGKTYNSRIHRAVLELIDEHEAEKAELLNRQNAMGHAK